MKKLISILLVLVLSIGLVSFTLAEEAEVADEGTGTQFEKVLLQKGTLMKKEFLNITTFETNPSSSYSNEEIEGQAAVLTDMTTGSKVFALRLEHSYYNSKYDSGTSTAVLDLPEIDSVISTLNSLKTEFAGTLKDYTEYEYKSNSGLKIGAYYAGSSNKKLYIRFSGSDIVRFDFDRVDLWIKFFEDVKAGIEKLQ